MLAEGALGAADFARDDLKPCEMANSPTPMVSSTMARPTVEYCRPVASEAEKDGGLPPEFFAMLDEDDDAVFYAMPRFVTHIDDDAIASVGQLYGELLIRGDVVDLMNSWISHFLTPPAHLRVLPLPSECVDDVVCCASVDNLTRPGRRVPGRGAGAPARGPFVCTFSNRDFATKAIRGWLTGTDADRCSVIDEHFAWTEVFEPPTISRRTPLGHRGDPAVRRVGERPVPEPLS